MAQRPPRSARWATTSSASAIRTARGGHTASRHRAESTPRRTTKTTATVSTVLFYDTVKGGDFRSRESNVYRLAELSVQIIDQAVAQGVPFAREYGGLLWQPFLWWRAGVTHLLRARANGSAAASRRLLRRSAARSRRGHRRDVLTDGDARPHRARRPGARHRHSLHDDR